MNLEVKSSNYRNDAILLGFSDLKRLKTERPLVFERGKGIFIFDENGKDYIESVSCFYCVSLGFSEERLVEAAHRQLKMLPMYSSAIHRSVPADMVDVRMRIDQRGDCVALERLEKFLGRLTRIDHHCLAAI